MKPKSSEPPEVYAIRRGKAGWELSRRSVFGAAAAAAAAAGAKRSDAAACASDAVAHGSWVRSVAISMDGRLLASGGADNMVKLWSVPDGALLKTFAGHSDILVSVAISADGRLLASCGWDKTIKLWSLPNGSLLKTLTGHSSDVYSVVVSPDGRLLASGGGDRAIRLWSLPDGKQLPACLMDPDASGPSVSGATYTKDGGVYSVPCGSPLPTGAVCTCNCVKGCSCVTAGGGCGVVYYYPN